MAWLGYRGTLVELPALNETVKESRNMTREFITVAGNRYAHALPRQPREWNVTAPAMLPRHRTALEQFVSGEWGAGPFVWVSEAAEYGNLLTPGQSSFRGLESTPDVVRTGPTQDSRGEWATSTMTAATVDAHLPWEITTPPVGYVHVHGDASGTFATPPHIRVRGYTEAGDVVTDDMVTSPHGATPGQFSQLVTLPTTVSHVKLSVRGMFSRLWLTSTPTATEYIPGQGCDKATVQTGGRTPLTAQTCAGLISSSGSFRILEIGGLS